MNLNSTNSFKYIYLKISQIVKIIPIINYSIVSNTAAYMVFDNIYSVINV